MNTYTVTAVNEQVRTWNTKAGAAMKSYRVTLRNKDGRELGNVELSRNATAPAPTVGENVEGTVDKSGQYGPKLQEPRKQGGGFSRAKTPEERRSIAMQSSLQRGVDAVRIAVDAKVFTPGDEADITNAAIRAADKFYARVIAAEKDAA